ncbi:phosphoribosyl-AMP cyclohydrolase [Candidatus Caldarchaeum subterraneum]|uniref:Phosphoribosyl-AMP cyclohydrolase n=1 Tax=Caldiarchaeum subterraneum TaxID=311458 RepID=E6N7A0_CALS0|nr:phosphoribosyl-AMP cyclohydrolase [Candidatus Caldarchaeum subterraneum]BAJ48169.1 phosphoribosyl-AMP cyclohydrolase [Candidatus Caldarchaeum subterraneum]BAJ50970.1 phosphoribosyl-AMP cyclohydrolase [Candidatus Caldarchaeum subterraneum]
MNIGDVKFDAGGLVPVVVQDVDTREVLMVAYANAEALRLTFETGFAHFWSRSRQRLWKKGEESGNIMHVVEVRVDCDGDTVLYIVKPTGPACHTGNKTCFYRKLSP